MKKRATSMRHLPHVTRTRLLAFSAVTTLAALMCTALPASGHASIPSSAAFGFLPNTAGGTGAPGTTPPYVPGSTVTIALRVPFEQTVQFGGSDDTTVDIKATVPAGWTNATCGAAKAQVNNASTANTNQPGDTVAGWTCEVLTVDSHQVLHWSGPQVVAPATASSSVQFVLFDVKVPTPAVQTTYNGKNGTEGLHRRPDVRVRSCCPLDPRRSVPRDAPSGRSRVRCRDRLDSHRRRARHGFPRGFPEAHPRLTQRNRRMDGTARRPALRTR